MDEFPGCPRRVLRAIPGDPMSRPREAAELFVVEIVHVARFGMLIAHDGRRRFEHSQAVDSGPFLPATDGVSTDAPVLTDLPISLTATPLLDYLVLGCRWQGMRTGFRAG